ncbi:hypothetical protein ACFL3S_11805 [Gemmatimonadota bacterium]
MKEPTPRSSRLSVFLAELKRRKVLRAIVGYAVGGVALIEGVDLVQPTLRFSDSVYDFVVLLVLLGFPIAVILSWFVDITQEGLRRTSDATPEQLAAHSPVQWSTKGWALVGVGTLLVAAAGYFAFFGPHREAPVEEDGHLVAVLPLENQTGDPTLETLGSLATSHIIDGLYRAERISAVPLRDVYARDRHGGGMETESGDARQTWAAELSATLAIVGGYFAVGDSIQFRLEVLDPSGRLLRPIEPVSGPRENPSRALDELQWRAASAVASLVTPGSPLARVNLHSHLPEAEALSLYLEGLLVQGLEGSSASMPYFEAAMERDSDYFAPLIQLIWVSYNTTQPQKGNSLCAVAQARVGEMNRFERIDMEGGCALTRRDYRTALMYARRMLEFLPNSIGDVGVSLLALNRPREAVHAFLQRDPHANEETWNWTPAIWRRLGQAYHLLGEFEEELEVARDLRENFPDDPGERGFEVAIPALAALGRLEELEEMVKERNLRARPGTEPFWLDFAAAELDAHDQPEAAARFWERQLELWRSQPDPVEGSPAGRWHEWYAGLAFLALDRAEEARLLFELYAGTYPMHSLGAVGIVEARLGNRPEAERISQRLADWDEPSLFGENTFLRAAVHANLGNRELAVQLLEQAVAGGYHDWMVLHRAPILKPLRGYPPFEEFMRPRG